MPQRFLSSMDASFQIDEAALMHEDLLDEKMVDVVHGALDVVGLIPGIGSVAEAINAIIYLKETPPNYLFAGLSIISCIPVIGEMIGEGGKLAIWAERAATKFPKTTRTFGSASRIIAKTKNAISTNKSKINYVLNWIAKPAKPGKEDKFASIRPYIPGVKRALDTFAGEMAATV